MARRVPAGHESETPLPPPQRVALHTFIEENHKLLAVLGVFTALTVFSAGLPLRALGTVLSFLFMAITVLLWFELLERFPAKTAGWRMNLFEILLTLTVLVLLLYWFVDYRAVWEYWLVIPIAALLLWVASAVMDRFDVFNRVFHARPGQKRPIRYALWAALLFASLVAAVSVAQLAAPYVDRWLDGVAQSAVAPLP
jgi:hypothetical protein